MKRTGLFFGSFNPVHIGHMVIANHFAEHSPLDEVWLVITPHNPHKEKAGLLEDYHRLELVRRACEPYPKLRPCDIEFKLPQPNYTVKTLAWLTEKYPEHAFSLIMGEDNLRTFHRWKNHEVIIENHDVYVYPRVGNAKTKSDTPYTTHPKVHRIDAPVMQLSATAIRKDIAEGKNTRPLFPDAIWRYVDEMNFYK